MDDLEKLLSEEETETPAPSSEPKGLEAEKPDEEVLKKEEIKANLDRAILEAENKLREVRAKTKKARSGEDEEDLPQIDMDDPSAKAWDKHIQRQVSPVTSEMEQEKAEIFRFALKEFLTDKPSLASKPEKVKELVSKYERIRESTGRTREGVLLDLDSAYAATFHKEILEVVRNRKVEQAKADILFSDIAVSKGATAYTSKENSTSEKLDEDDRKILARWGVSPQEWQEDRKKYQ